MEYLLWNMFILFCNRYFGIPFRKKKIKKQNKNKKKKMANLIRSFNGGHGGPPTFNAVLDN